MNHRLWWSNSEPVHIGQRRIGPGQDVYVVAEAGVNHNGSVVAAMELVDAAKAAGADAVKFQVFQADELVAPNAPTADYQAKIGHSDQRAMLRELQLTRREFTELFDHCQDIDIEFLATPFSPNDVTFLKELGVNAVKLASPDAVNVLLLEQAVATGLPVIVSTGACTEEEIENAVRYFADTRALNRLILMHCVSSYPTPLCRAGLAQIGKLARQYSRPVGFSDHTPEWLTGALAVAAGADILEKHFTLDRTQRGPDHGFSLEAADLKRYVQAARQARAALGDGQRELLEGELEVRHVSRSSLVAAVDIPAGAVLTRPMLCAKRPGGGIQPWQIEQVIGRRTACRIPADTMLAWEMLQDSEPTKPRRQVAAASC